MSSHYQYPEVLPTRPIQPHIQSACPSPRCNAPLEFPLPSPPPSQGAPIRIRCFRCNEVNNVSFRHPDPSSSKSFAGTSRGGETSGSGERRESKADGASTPRRRRKIGTQENPLEMEYYETLGVSAAATQDDIKKAYRRLAIKHHPDKNPNDPEATTRFKALSVAYQTLSDPSLRARYNEFGAQEGRPEGGFVDPEAVFGQLFGGERFVSIVGEISLGREMKRALQEAEEAENSGEAKTEGEKGEKKVLSPEEKTRKEEKDRKVAAEKRLARDERVRMLVAELERKLSIFTESATGDERQDHAVTSSWRQICELEAEELKKESYGLELLHAVGFVYAAKARHHLASAQTFLGVGGWLHNVQGKYHVFSETVSTLRTALELKSIFDQLAAAENSPTPLSPEDKKRLEESAAEKGLQALFKGAKLEVESVLRDVCDRILSENNPPPTTSIAPSSPPPSATFDSQFKQQVQRRTGSGSDPRRLALKAKAMLILGEAYLAARKDGEAESEYVRVDTNASRERDGAGKR